MHTCRIFVSTALNAGTFTVNCNNPGPTGKISTYLKFLSPGGPNTLNIRGTCKENLTINQFDRLSLIAVPGAVIEDSSGGQQPVINITDSRRISILNLTIIGSSSGVFCFDESFCRFSGNTIRGSTGAGVWVNHSHAMFSGDIFQDSGGSGLSIEASNVTAYGVTSEGNGESGIYNADGSVLYAFGISIENNRSDGILVVSQSHMLLGLGTVTNNAYNGIDVNDQSEVLLLQNTITANGYDGVAVGDLSLANLGNGGTYTNNGMDIGCLNQVSVAKNLQGVNYATTNCLVPTVPSNATEQKGSPNL